MSSVGIKVAIIASIDAILMTLRVSFRKVSRFNCADDCFMYISLKLPESLNRVIF